jgi:hypothetical protein
MPKNNGFWMNDNDAFWQPGANWSLNGSPNKMLVSIRKLIIHVLIWTFYK